MKVFLRLYLFTFLALHLTQSLVGGFEYPSIASAVFVLFTLSLTVVHFFVFPLFRIVGFPTKGFGGLLLRVVLSGISIYFSVGLLTGISVVSTVLPQIQFQDIILPARYLSPIESLIASSLVFSIIYGFFIWLCPGKK